MRFPPQGRVAGQEICIHDLKRPIGSGQAWDTGNPGNPERGRASEQSITRRGLRIYQRGDQIKALSGDRWDVASQGTEGVWCRVSFAGEPHVRVSVPHHRKGVPVQAYRGGRARAAHIVGGRPRQEDRHQGTGSGVPGLRCKVLPATDCMPRQAREEAEVQVHRMQAAVPGQPGL